jgi:hypothetical protein
MWALLGAGGEAYGGTLKPEIEKAERQALEREGLIEIEKKKRGAFWLTVTDKGWDWAELHLADPLPEKASSGAFVLRAWLTRLSGYLRAKDARLSEFIVGLETPTMPAHSEPPAADYAGTREKIRGAYRDVAGGFDRRVLLRDLRPKLKDIDRKLVDATLMQMLRNEEVSLMQLDYRPDVSDADHAAALKIGNEPRHIIWISK